jgi:hypothetical protein
MKARRLLFLLTAWLSFDLATPLPGAFEFEVQDSEIEQSIHVRRESPGKRTTASPRPAPQQRLELDPPTRGLAPPVPTVRQPIAGAWLPQVRLAHLPSARPGSSSEDH